VDGLTSVGYGLAWSEDDKSYLSCKCFFKKKFSSIVCSTSKNYSHLFFLVKGAAQPKMATDGSLWLAIVITIVASTSCSVGKALQKEATRHLPKFSLEEKIIRQYTLSRTWVIGLAADLIGGIIQVAAFALAPVSIIQPVSGVGLVGLALYSHFYMKEKLQQWEWVAVGMAALGTVGLGASSASGPDDKGADSRPGALRMLVVLSLVGISVSSITTVRRHQRQMQRRGGVTSDKAVAALYGLQAGGCFGLSAATCRTGFLMAARRWTWVPFGLACSFGLSSTGFILQTCGLKEGSTVVVCTCVAVTSMVTGVLVGLLGLGESMPGASFIAAMRLLSWTLILVGVVALASGPGGTRELALLLLQRVPPTVWQRLPVDFAVRAKSWASSKAGLPEVAPNTGGSMMPPTGAPRGSSATIPTLSASPSPHRRQ